MDGEPHWSASVWRDACELRQIRDRKPRRAAVMAQVLTAVLQEKRQEAIRTGRFIDLSEDDRPDEHVLAAAAIEIDAAQRQERQAGGGSSAGPTPPSSAPPSPARSALVCCCPFHCSRGDDACDALHAT